MLSFFHFSPIPNESHASFTTAFRGLYTSDKSSERLTTKPGH